MTKHRATLPKSVDALLLSQRVAEDVRNLILSGEMLPGSGSVRRNSPHVSGLAAYRFGRH